ncbi:hypothetical protein VL04_20545 [Chromobacterium violaceum]|uniref:hypothetical protein n=1 Tax=Chromobacterium violaceum TaxID=536 RepID=UPI000654418C|nr:hypothetical protein [Chromobacterium violaceum]KMN51801.1 hypothetical protein VK93_00195 [Chromobacterium violaceum]KMN84286.1 hypothetical protein VL02_20535 [Chromobacterium violaceum]KMN88459.1 hypothetical protein VL04_20545 [Chromobacterium violaceum]KMO02510.1 hypothetical protein VL16_18290 [Chromobacterium violaceum]MBA8737471.1 hypothetical protein [Chromobacterium violaceum]
MEWMVIAVLVPSIVQLCHFSFFHDIVVEERKGKWNLMVCACLPLAFIMCGVLYFFSGAMAETLLVSLALVPGGALGLMTGLFFGAWARRKRVKDADERC